MRRKALLVCGILSSLVYAGADVLGGIRYEGYGFTSQTISELAAIGAPSRPLVVPLSITYDVLVIAFGLGVWGSAGRKRPLRFTAGLLVGLGVIGFAAPFAPMHVRGAELTLTDTMHIVLTSVTVLLILLAIGFGAIAFGKRFRLYSIGTILILLVFGTLAGLDGPRLAANLPTPWMGVYERINIYGYLLWVVVLAITLWRVRNTAAPDDLGGRRGSR
ncbi:MAG TPA: DUF998 domain-containing protein [Gemmatimonadales bacterium]|jgi:hypothetical protein